MELKNRAGNYRNEYVHRVHKQVHCYGAANYKLTRMIMEMILFIAQV